MLNRLKRWAARRLTTIFLFTYGLLVGTAAPVLLSRCTASGGCGSCAGVCGLALGILPLVLFIGLKGRLSKMWRIFRRGREEMSR